MKTTWNDASTEPVNTGIFRTSTYSHSVVNGHAHAQVRKKRKFIASKTENFITDLLIYLFILQAFSHEKPNSFSNDAKNVRVSEDDEAKSQEQEDDDLIEADTHRSSLYEYNH